MARYMGGPRRHPQAGVGPIPIESVNDYHYMPREKGDEAWVQTTDEIADSDDHGSSPRADNGGLFRQEQPNAVAGDKGDGVAFYDNVDDEYDDDTEPTTSAADIACPFPGLQGRTPMENAPVDNVPRPKRQRSLSIPIHYRSRFGTGLPILQPQPLPLAYGWMVRGTAEHVEDLHLSGIPFCSKEVHSKVKIEVLGEYTWVEVTPSQDESYERYPAIYVPGNARTWRPVQLDTSLHQDDVRSITAQEIRDDNLNRQPRYPYEPALRALESADKVTNLSEVDIITDADTLALLLSFIQGTSAARRVKEPFRLELKTVRGTLFISQSHKPGSNQAGPPNKKTRHDPSISAPDWAAGVLGHIGTRDARLPYSGGHYRLVRYRFGSVVLAVRVKVDFVYEHRRKGAAPATADPLRGVQPDFIPRHEGDVAQIWKTTVVRSGTGTKPAAAGVASVRYEWQDLKVRMRALLPQLWFSRTPFVVDCQVSYPDLRVTDVALVNSRRWYPSYERGYQNSLRRLAGLLRHLQVRTREMGGGIVLVVDPVHVCFVLLKPVINLGALPEDLILKFWGPEAERGDEVGRDSTPEVEQSDLTDLSSTPSLPTASDIANVGASQPDKSKTDGEANGKEKGKENGKEKGKANATANGTANGEASGEANGDAGPKRMLSRSPTRAESQHGQGIDSFKMVTDWNESVDSPVRQSIEEGGAGYESGDEAAGDELSPEFDADTSLEGNRFDGNRSYGNRSPSVDSVMVGESALESGLEGADRVLNALALQMNRPGVMQDSHDNLTAVARTADVEVLRGQHSLLMVDRHLTSGMHSSSEDEWPPKPPTHPGGRITNAAPDVPEPRHSHGDLELRSIRGGSVVPTAATPPGPGDFDAEGNVIPRHVRNRDDPQAYSDGNNSPAPAPRRREYLSGRYTLNENGRPRLSDGIFSQRNYVTVDSDSDDDDDSDAVGSEDEAEDEDELDEQDERDEQDEQGDEADQQDDEGEKDAQVSEDDQSPIAVTVPDGSGNLQNGVAENSAVTTDHSTPNHNPSPHQTNFEE